MFEYTDYKRAVPRLAVGVEAQIERINQGEILADIIELEELDHFYALIALNGIVETVADTVIENVRHSNYGNQYILSFKRVCSLLFR